MQVPWSTIWFVFEQVRQLEALVPEHVAQLLSHIKHCCR